MSTEYTPPPGRPQASPPDTTTPQPYTPSERGLLGRMAFQAKMEADPEYAAAVRSKMSEGQRAAFDKANRLLERECNRLNKTETRGVWFTHVSLQRYTGWDRKRCDNLAYRHKIEDARHKRMQRFLLPHDKLPEGKKRRLGYYNPQAEPKAQRVGIDSPPPTFGRRVVQVHIAVTRKEIEEKLTELLSLKSPVFRWDGAGNVNITSEE